MEGADERRPVITRPAGDLALEVLREADRVAQQRHPLGLAFARLPTCQLLGLLKCEHGLPAPRSPTDLDAVQQPGHLQQGGLLLGQPVRLRGTILGVGVHVVRRDQPARQDFHDEVDLVVGRRSLALPRTLGVQNQPAHQIGLVAAVVQRPPRTVGCLGVLIEDRVRRHHRVTPRDVVAPLPPRIAGDVVAHRVLGRPHLGHRVDLDVLTSTRLPPTIVVVPDAAALDLDHQNADLGHQHDQVGLVVLVLVGQSNVREQDVVLAEPLLQPLPHLLLGSRRERRSLGDQPHHAGTLPWAHGQQLGFRAIKYSGLETSERLPTPLTSRETRHPERIRGPKCKPIRSKAWIDLISPSSYPPSLTTRRQLASTRSQAALLLMAHLADLRGVRGALAVLAEALGVEEDPSWTSAMTAERAAQRLDIGWESSYVVKTSVNLDGLNALLDAASDAYAAGSLKRVAARSAPGLSGAEWATFNPACSKIEAVTRLAALTGAPREWLGPGSKEHKSALLNLATNLFPNDERIDTSSKHRLGSTLAKVLNAPWSKDFTATGQTIKLTGLNAILAGAERHLGRLGEVVTDALTTPEAEGDALAAALLASLPVHWDAKQAVRWLAEQRSSRLERSGMAGLLR